MRQRCNQHHCYKSYLHLVVVRIKNKLNNSCEFIPLFPKPSKRIEQEILGGKINRGQINPLYQTPTLITLEIFKPTTPVILSQGLNQRRLYYYFASNANKFVSILDLKENLYFLNSKFPLIQVLMQLTT